MKLLPLSFHSLPAAVLGRSIGLHLPTGPLFACAAIRRFYVAPNNLSVRFPVGEYDRYRAVANTVRACLSANT